MGIEDEIRRQLDQIENLKQKEVDQEKALNEKRIAQGELVEDLCARSQIEKIIRDGMREVEQHKPWKLSLNVYGGLTQDFYSHYIPNPTYFKHYSIKYRNVSEERSAAQLDFVIGDYVMFNDNTRHCDTLKYCITLHVLRNHPRFHDRLLRPDGVHFLNQEHYIWSDTSRPNLNDPQILNSIIAEALVKPWWWWDSPSMGGTHYNYNNHEKGG